MTQPPSQHHRICFYREGNDPLDCTKISYKQLLDEVSQFSFDVALTITAFQVNKRPPCFRFVNSPMCSNLLKFRRVTELRYIYLWCWNWSCPCLLVRGSESCIRLWSVGLKTRRPYALCYVGFDFSVCWIFFRIPC